MASVTMEDVHRDAIQHTVRRPSMKNSTRAKKLHQVSEHHLIIGVDIGSEKNYARAMNWRGEEYTKKGFLLPQQRKRLFAPHQVD